MKPILAILLWLWVPFSVFAQRTITGKVTDAANGSAIAGSSVFISGTSVGTISDQSGNFELNDVPGGRHDLVISSIGYETNVFSFSSDQLPLRLKVEMTVKVKELENVTVEPSIEEGWDKWGQTFRDYFIGYTPNAMSCEIKNENAIRFRYYKKSRRVIAYCDEPIVIENKALGYMIRYQLEEFEIDFQRGATTFAGYPFFEDMDKARKGLKRHWQRERDKAFYGSMMHFMRCLYDDSLLQSGFEVRRMAREPNKNKERIRQLYRQEMANSVKTDDKAVKVFNPLEKFSKDSIEYYEKVLRQNDYREIYSKDLVPADSLISKGENKDKILFFTDYLSVTYKNEKEDKGYLVYNHEARAPFFQRSLIFLPNLRAVAIDENGNYFPPQEVFSLGYWGWSDKVGDMLPSNYEPEQRTED